MTEQPYPDETTRRLITFFALLASIMTALDTTIANVALPHIQGSISAAPDEITWVLTSYIVATAVTLPLTGWLANRFGVKRLMLVSVSGFVAASMLCGIATSLGQLVGFRLLQGILGAALVPMSQAILLNINPPEHHGSAMAIWGMGAVIGPIIGPTLGGFITESLSWRWVFFINAPIGLFTLFGLVTFLPEWPTDKPPKLDLQGFAMLGLSIASLQLMLDRGQQQGWFSSTEICVEAALALFFFYAFLVHVLTVRDPFLNLAMFKDRNFLLGTLYSFIFGILLFSVISLLPTMLQRLMDYPVVLTGLVTSPRGVTTFIAMSLGGRLLRYVDARYLMLCGFSILALAMYLMANYSLQMDAWTIITTSALSGFGNGLIFVPLTTIAFATLDARYRNEASAISNLIRSIGSALGISALQAETLRNTAIVHARLIEAIRPDNPVLAMRSPGFDFDVPALVAGLDAEITRQANMVAYVDGYWAMFVAILIVMPLVFFVRPSRPRPGDEPTPVHLD